MRLVVWALALGFCLAPAVRADVYLYRDRLGVLHFTNAPTEGPSQFLFKDRPLGPAPRFLTYAPRTAPTVTSGQPTAYDPLIREIAERHNVEYALVKAVIKAESAFDRLAVSPKGALGLMQLMPRTAAQHQVRNVFLPRDNIEGGVSHLRLLLDRYGGNLPLAIAAYNAGTQRVEDAGGVPPILETREYLARVLRYRSAYMREAPGVLADNR
jgi:soluble lytic murein transglycosylase